MAVKRVSDGMIEIQSIITIIILILYIIFMTINIFNSLSKRSANNVFTEIEKKEIKLIKLEDDIKSIEKKVESLKNDSTKDDVLDEEIRKNFNYSKENETIIYNNEI